MARLFLFSLYYSFVEITLLLLLTSAAHKSSSIQPGLVTLMRCHTLRVTENESAPIQLTQCRFPGLAISNAELLVRFSNKIYGNDFIKQHSETVVV